MLLNAGNAILISIMPILTQDGLAKFNV